MHRPDLTLHPLRSLAIAFIDNEDVGDLHDAGLDGLHIIAHAGNQDHHRDIRQADNVNFILAHAYGFHQHHVLAAGIEHRGHVSGGARQAAQKSARRHAADVDAGVRMVRLHADAIAENRPASVRTGRINRDDAHRLLFLAILARQLIHQRALAAARRAGQSDDARPAAVRKQRFQ